jgi:chemotaxis protein CheX
MTESAESYQLIKGDGYYTLRLIGDVDSKSIKGLVEKLKTVIVDPCPHFVVNMEVVSSMTQDCVRLLLGTQVSLKKFNKQMRLITVSPTIQNIFKNLGVDTAFKITKGGLREALAELGLVTKKALDTDFINPFLLATINVLSIQAQVKSKPGKIYLKQQKDKFVGDVSGVIGIVSESFNGSVVISFPEKTFLTVISGMLGENFSELNQEIVDGAGEITNMIFGQAKISLNEKGYGIKTAIPSVVSGKDHSLTALTKGPTVVVPFESSAGEFFVEICISN